MFLENCNSMCPRVLLELARSSEAHAYPPRVVGENFVLFLYDTRVCAFVDGVGHYGDVVVFQRDVVGLGVLQQLPVFVPAETGATL